MDELNKIYKKCKKHHKNAILFDRVSNFNMEMLVERIASYPSHILDDYILSVEPNALVSLISSIREKNISSKPVSAKHTAFRVFSPQKEKSIIENRTGQNRMTEDVLYALNNEGILIGEAPPGTGKSLAYLMPAVECIKNSMRTIISTNTKNLQMQIFNNDTQIACNLKKSSFSACMLKGIGNYLCLHKYYENRDMIEPLMRLAIDGFMYMYESGDLAEMKFFYKTDMNNITSDSEYCMDRDCPYFDKCYFMKLRETAKTSDIIFTNHYLSLIDASMSNRFFGEYQIMIFDEAHNLENVVTELFAYEYSSQYTMRMLHYFQKRMHNAVRNMIQSQSNELRELFENILHMINELIEQNDVFMLDIRDAIVFDDSKRRTYKQELFSSNAERIKYILTLYRNILRTSKETMDIINESYSSKRLLFHLIRYVHEKMQFFHDAFAVVTDAENDEYAFFYEAAKNQNVTFYGVPVDTGEMFSNLMLKGSGIPIIFTSATLSVNRNFDLFKSQIGLNLVERQYHEGIYETSFNWDKQMNIFCITGMGNPNEKAFLQRAAEFIRFICADNKKTLVLATSYEQIGELSMILKGNEFLFHKKGDNPELIISSHKEADSSVLIGTNRYWEGVDLPGELLERVIILKMPFAVPDDPVMEKRCGRKEEMGINPFMGYTLPLAVLKLKQGVGRLIRKSSDKGTVYILDERIVRKRYGSIVMKSMFVKPEIINYNNIVEV